MKTIWARAAACVLLALASVGLAQAAAVRAYLSASGEPFNDFSNSDAMTAAFGTDWDRLQYGDAFSGYGMLYIDGGSETAAEMVSFLDSNRGALEAYVLGGGRLFINAATENQTLVDLVFGAKLNEQSIDSRGNTGMAVDGGSSLFAGAGTAWGGYFFSHDDIQLADGYSSLIVDDLGRTVLAGGFFGSGYVMLGGQTNTSYHEGFDGSDPFQLRVNELLYADSVTAPVVGEVPEPGSLALVLVAGLALRLGRRAGRG